MKAHFKSDCCAAKIQRFVGKRQRCVQAKGCRQVGTAALDGFDKTCIFRDPGPGFIGAIAIGHFVTQRGPDAGLVNSVSDNIQRPIDEIGGGVMIDKGGGAVLDGIHNGKQR